MFAALVAVGPATRGRWAVPLMQRRLPDQMRRDLTTLVQAIGRHLDRARDGRRLLAAGFVLYGLAIVGASVAVGRAPVIVAAGLVVLAGLCGPLLIGGLSSRLAGLAGPDEHAQRRAQGWDAVTYGIGGSAGPAAVAGLAAVASPRVSMAMLSGAAIVAAGLALTLPRGVGPAVARGDVLPVRRALRLIAVSGPLRRATYATMVVAVPGGAVAVVAVALGRHFATGAVSGAVLAAAFGLGNLVGSLLVTAFPLAGEPETLLARFGVVVGVTFAICAVVPTYPLGVIAFGLAGAANAPFFTATLAARSAYAPPQARAQVFVSMSALKVAAAALGTALAGAPGRSRPAPASPCRSGAGARRGCGDGPGSPRRPGPVRRGQPLVRLSRW